MSELLTQDTRRCDRPSPEGDAELLAGAVPLLRRGGSAADEQRPGAVLRLVSLPRAALQRPEGGLPGDGGAGLGAAGGGGRDAVAADRGGGLGPRGPGGLAIAPGDVGAATGGTDAGPPVPPGSQGQPPKHGLYELLKYCFRRS